MSRLYVSLKPPSLVNSTEKRTSSPRSSVGAPYNNEVEEEELESSGRD